MLEAGTGVRREQVRGPEQVQARVRLPERPEQVRVRVLEQDSSREPGLEQAQVQVRGQEREHLSSQSPRRHR